MVQTTINFKVIKPSSTITIPGDHPASTDNVPSTLNEDLHQFEEVSPIKIEEPDSPTNFALFSQPIKVIPEYTLSKEDFLRPDYGVHTCQNYPARAISEPAQTRQTRFPSRPTKRHRRTKLQIEEDDLCEAFCKKQQQLMLEENIQAHNTGREVPFKMIGLSTPKKLPLKLKKRRVATHSPAFITEEIDAWSEL